MKRRSFTLIALFIVLALVVLSACVPAAKKDTELNVLCTPQEEWCQGMKQEFEAKTGIPVNYVRMSSGEALARIKAEKDNPQFDIWWGGPIDGYVAAAQEGLLEPYDSPNYQEPAGSGEVQGQGQLLGGQSTWGAWASAPTRIGWPKNPGVKAPESWEDLLKPEFEGQIMVAHPSTSGTSYTALATILQLMGEEKGWEFIQKYAGQVAQFTKSGAAPAKFVGQGEAAVCIVFSHDIVHEIDDNKAPLELTFPKDGTGYEIGGMALIKGAKHPNAAKQVVRLGVDCRGPVPRPEVQSLPGAHRQGRQALAPRAPGSQPHRL